MTISNLIVLVARLFAIAVGVYAVSGGINSSVYYAATGASVFYFLGYYVGLFLLGVLVWFMPYSFIRLLTGHKGEVETPSEAINGEQFANIAFATLALYLLYRVASDIGYWSFFYFYFEESAYDPVELPLDQKAAMFATALEALLMIVLLVGRKRVLRFIKTLRS